MTSDETPDFDAADTVSAPSKPDQSDVIEAAAKVLHRIVCDKSDKDSCNGGKWTARKQARALQAAHLLTDPADRDEPTLESELRSARAEKSELKDVIDELRATVDRVRLIHHHRDSGMGGFCEGDAANWPCPTIRALDGGEQS